LPDRTSPPATPERGAHDAERKEPTDPDQLFREVWGEFSPEIFKRCLAWMDGRRADADEAFSRTALQVFRKLPLHARNIVDLRSWLLRLTRNVCMSLHRETRRRREEALEPDADSLRWEIEIAADPNDPERSYLQKELLVFLERSIGGLPERLRQTVWGRLQFDSDCEIADHLAINETNVRKRMQEARRILARRLEDYRSGTARMPSQPEASAWSSFPAREASDGITRAIQPLQIRLASGVEIDALLRLHFVPRRASPRRRAGLERYVEEHPGGWKRCLELAQERMVAGEIERAVPLLERVVGQQPRLARAWIDLVAIYRLMGEPATAQVLCDGAVAILPDAAESDLLRGLAESIRGRHRSAEQAFEAAARRDPANPEPLLALAEARLTVGRPADALAAIERALAVAPDDVVALTLGWEAMHLAGRSAEARRRNRRALELDPAHPLALARWGETEFRHAPASPEEAPRLKSLVRLAATRADARRSLGLWLAGQGGARRAASWFAALLERRPRYAQGWVEYARLLDELGLAAEAARAMARARELHTPARTVDLLACRIFARAGLAEEAIGLADDLLARWGSAWDVAATAAWVLVALGREPSRALALSATAVERQPCLPAAWIEHASLLLRLERPAEARAALETAWVLLPEDGGELAATVALELARLHRRLGDPESASLWARRHLAAAGAQFHAPAATDVSGKQA